MISLFRVALSGVLLTTILAAVGCAPVAEPPNRVFLNIKDRGWDPNRPDTDLGWCAEASIQMALDYYGKEVPQAAINRAAGAGCHRRSDST